MAEQEGYHETLAEQEQEKITAMKRERFNKIYGDLQDKDIMREVLFKLHFQNELLDKTRSNTSKIVWWLIVIPIIVGVLMLLIRGDLN